MADTTQTVRHLLIRELEGFIREIELLPDDDVLWRSADGVTNSCGTLARHVAGNLQHFVGAALGSTGYVRDREREFGSKDGTRADIIGELKAAIEVVDRTLSSLPEDALAKPFPMAPPGLETPVGVFLAHLVSHTAFHLGQVGYLRRVLTGDTTSSGPLPMKTLGDI